MPIAAAGHLLVSEHPFYRRCPVFVLWALLLLPLCHQSQHGLPGLKISYLVFSRSRFTQCRHQSGGAWRAAAPQWQDYCPGVAGAACCACGGFRAAGAQSPALSGAVRFPTPTHSSVRGIPLLFFYYLLFNKIICMHENGSIFSIFHWHLIFKAKIRSLALQAMSGITYFLDIAR